MFSRWHRPTVARGVRGTRLLAGRRFAGGKCVCWWEVALLVEHCSNSAGETRFAGQTRFAGPNANSRPNADCRPDAHRRPQRESPAGRGLPPKRNLLARTQFAGTKNKVTECFSFWASDHDGVFSFPAALGGAEAYLFRWLASNMHLFGCAGIIARSSHSKGFGLDRAEPAR